MNNVLKRGAMGASKRFRQIRMFEMHGNKPHLNLCVADNLGSASRTRGLTTDSSPFAVVDHSSLYQKSMDGQHGSQLALAELEGIGKDDPDFDPFLEEELEEARLLAMEGKAGNDESNDESIPEAELVGDSQEDFDEESDDEEEEDQSSLYNNDGSLKRAKSELATLRAGSPAGGMFGVIELAGSQHKVTTDDLVIVNRLKPVDEFKVGSIHTLKDVLLVSSSSLTLVGMPYVAGAEVDIMVEEITKDAKVIIFKNRRRKHSKRKNGFRRDISMLRILDVRMPDSYQDHAHDERPLPDLESATASSSSSKPTVVELAA